MIRIAPTVQNPQRWGERQKFTARGSTGKRQHSPRSQGVRGSRGRGRATLTEGVARLQHAVARPLQGEGQLEQLLPELGGDRVGLVADQRREHLLSRAGRRRRARRAQPRRRRRRAHWIWSPPGKRTRGALGFDAREDWASEEGNGRPRVESRRSEGFKRRERERGDFGRKEEPRRGEEEVGCERSE